MSDSTVSTIWIVSIIVVILGAVGGLAGGLAYGVPQCNVYAQKLSGEAQLKKAEFSRRIAVLEARAELDSAELRKQTAITRAEGVARANIIIGESITPEYIQWLWVDGLHTGKNQTIYIPTEANLPILEAFRNVRQSPVEIVP